MVAALVAGAVLTVVGVFGSWRARNDLQIEPYNQKKAYTPKLAGSDAELSCQGVLESRARRLRELDKDIQRSEKRGAQLETLLLRPGSPHFLGARAELTRELEFERGLRERHTSLLIDPDAARTSVLMLIGALLAALVTVLTLRSSERLRRLLADMAPPYRGVEGWWLASVLLVSVPALVGQFVLRFAEDKTWFGWDSYCISIEAFLWVKVAIVGSQMMAACPLAVLAHASRPELLGQARGPAAGAYVRFTTTWTFWGLLLTLVFGVVWLSLAFDTARTPTERVSYSLPVMGAAVVNSLVLYRFVRNMRALRAGHEQRDPTSAFFDDVPWRLPPTLLALGTAAWLILERFGIIDGLLGK